MVTKTKTCSSKPRGPKYIDKTVSKLVRFKSESLRSTIFKCFYSYLVRRTDQPSAFDNKFEQVHLLSQHTPK